MARRPPAAVFAAFMLGAACAGGERREPGPEPIQQTGAPGPSLKIVSLSGQLQVRGADGSVWGVFPGSAAPDVPAGSEVALLSGRASFKLGAATIVAQAPAVLSLSALQGRGSGAQIATIGKDSKARILLGEARLLLGGDCAVALPDPVLGSVTISVTRGKAAISLPNAPARPLAPGAAVAVPLAPASSNPAPTTKKP